MKLFVAKLPQNVTSERLRAMFESYGQVVDAKIIMDRDTGKSKCYGFVEMADADSAKSAIESLNGIQMEGREILVKESDPAPPRSGDFNKGPRQGGGGFRPSFNSGGGDRRSSGPRPDRWGDDRNRGGSGGGGNRYGDNDRNKRRYDDDDDRPRRKRI